MVPSSVVFYWSAQECIRPPVFINRHPVFIIYRYLPEYQSGTFFSKLPIYLLLLVLSIITFWVSELVVTLSWQFWSYLFSTCLKKEKLKSLFGNLNLFIDFRFIYYLSRYILAESLVETVPYDRYGEKFINDLPAILTSISMFISSIGQYLHFRFRISCSASILTSSWSLLCYSSLIKVRSAGEEWSALGSSIYSWRGHPCRCYPHLNWVFINGMPRRYFVGAHISLWLAFLILFSNFSPGRVKNIITALVFVAVVPVR